MRLVVGLGNPGAKYARNRHNIGFMAVEAIHDHGVSFGPWRTRFFADVSEGVLDGEKILLMKPQTYMNESGRAVGEAARFFKLSPADVTVLYDELDLAPGKVRIKIGGGSGGHNGIRSIDAHLGKDYQRVRLGIGHPGHKDRVTGHVLGDFSKTEQNWLGPLLDGIGRETGLLVSGRDGEFCNRLHRAVASTKPSDEGAAKPDTHPRATTMTSRTRAREIPPQGPLAQGLSRLFGKKD